MFQVDDTIAAIATARDGATRGIVRVSGPNALDCLAGLFTSANGESPPHRTSAHVISGHVRCEPPIGEVPCDVYLWPTRRSYTRQPCFEVHTLGSPPILDAVVAAACRTGARLAQPGEFTLRAFLAGRLDLTQAEAVLGVIDSRSTSELETALDQLAGGLARPLQSLRSRLLDVLAHLEAGLDFVEEDIEFIHRAELETSLQEFHSTIAALVRQIAERGEAAGEPRVVCIGWPNVGKSSLFNALAQDAVVIVSEVEGTTRDYVTKRIDVHGLNVLLTDTAGVELVERDSQISAASGEMRRRQIEQAALRLICLDASRRLNDWEREQLAGQHTLPTLVVLTKGDLPRACEFRGESLVTSSLTGEGLAQLREAIRRHWETGLHGEWGVVASTGFRCRDSLVRAEECLDRARDLARLSGDEELIAAELRLALDELGAVLGAVYTDDILDRIFSRFCIGK